MDICYVLLTGNYIVQHVPMFGARILPRCFVLVRLLEECVSYCQFMLSTGLEQEAAIGVFIPNSMVAEHHGP